MTQTTKKQDDHFILKLLKLSQDRGSLSHLRRYWSETTIHYAYPVLGRLGVHDPHCPDAVTAALFSINPHHKLAGPSIGKAALLLGERKDDKHPYDSHFRRLLASESLLDAATQLYKLVARLERDNISLDYNQLMWNLRNWDNKSSDIKARWAMDFWQAPSELAPSHES